MSIHFHTPITLKITGDFLIVTQGEWVVRIIIARELITSIADALSSIHGAANVNIHRNELLPKRKPEEIELAMILYGQATDLINGRLNG